MTEKSQIAELIAALLADDLGLKVPQAAVVDVPPGLERIVADQKAALSIGASPGSNFGSVHLGTGFTTWPAERAPHGAQRDQALDIFAFDALVQNMDRKPRTPNLWVRSDTIGVLDHELAFNFLALPIIGGAGVPWRLASNAKAFRFLEQHIFYPALRGSSVLSLGTFQQKLSSLSKARISEYLAQVPEGWPKNTDFPQKIANYLNQARLNAPDLIRSIKHILR